MCILGTTYILSVYPTAIRVEREHSETIHIDWQLTGLIKDFTVTWDLERNRTIVHGIAKEGYFSYQVLAEGAHLLLYVDRAKMGQLRGTIRSTGLEICLQPKENSILSLLDEMMAKPKLERLSFGSHKAQNWEKIQTRLDPLEYFPFWFTAGQYATHKELAEKRGALECMQRCQELLHHPSKELLVEKLSELFQVGFEGMLVPKLYDNHYLGVLQAGQQGAVPHELVRQGYLLIRSMLLQEKQDHIAILPHLASCFHAGRCLDLALAHGKCSMEWSKKLLKKVILLSEKPQTLHFSFQKPLKSFRLRSLQGGPLKRASCDAPLTLGHGVYVLDRFEK